MGANELDVYNIRKRLHDQLCPVIVNHSDSFVLGVYITLHVLSDITGIDFQISPKVLSKYAKK